MQKPQLKEEAKRIAEQIAGQMIKRCSRCEEEKTVEMFPRNPECKYGVEATCRIVGG